MKLKNAPSRKLARQLLAAKNRKPLSAEEVQRVEFARTIRTKKLGTERGPGRGSRKSKLFA